MLEDQKLQPEDVLLAPPKVVGMLDDIAGGEPNLLPVTLLRSPLRVDVPRWLNADPSPGKAQTLSLRWDGQLVDEKTWESPIEDDELFIEVPVALLREGQARVDYTVSFWNGNDDASEALLLTIDKTAPELGGARGELSFPDLGAADLTDAYLKAHDNVLEGVIPTYDQPGAGDTVIFYWNTEPFENVEVGRRVLAVEDLSKPLTIDYDGDMIRERGDGQRYAFYEVEDRAGNLSRPSSPLTLTVAARPIPRVLPWLEVPQAAGSSQTLVLALETVRDSVETIIPDEAVIAAGEAFTVQWGEPELVGSLSMTGMHPVRRYSVPVRNAVNMSGKTLSVYYQVQTTDGPQTSVIRKVSVTPIPREQLPTPQLAGHRSGEIFRLGDHRNDPPLRLEKWLHSSTDQRVNIMLEGVSASGGKVHAVMRNHEVTAQEVTDGIGKAGDVLVPLSFLQQLTRGQVFYIKVSASFDKGSSWPAQPNFPILALTLQN
ncbi:hypothetical protein J2W83_004273 [Pseudomonas hunanensis]|uniref:Uncharacterized protein n=1 Tax=Pseudomonas hunanensis TaxID=1247546 RepID=A0ACC6K8D2_9PSED|nr:hypothetical protein [Pseudomonas hunanensis]MDR6714637.1 hypothetical protein [Pseudomonas hunanensis]